MPASDGDATAGGVPALSALLLLADGRFPTGGHAHSGGMEPAVASGGVHDVGSVEVFLVGRLTTSGLVGAAFAAAACRALTPTTEDPTEVTRRLRELDDELTARTPSPALRATSRRLGRQVLRTGRIVWPHPGLDALATELGSDPHQAVALGAVAAAAGIGPEAAALMAAHEAVVGAGTAAVKLLAVDPFVVHATLGLLAPLVDAVAADAARYANRPPAELPAAAGPLADVAAEHHAVEERRLFAS